MAKKRKAKKKKFKKSKKRKKVKRKKAKRKVKQVRVKIKTMKIPRERALTTIQSAYLLSLTGSIIVFIAGILALFFNQLALPNILCGLAMLIATSLIRKSPKTMAIIILLFGIVTLVFPPYGFIVGPILALIGSAILLIKK